MSLLFSRNQVVLAKVETALGTDAAPTGADAILCEVINPTVEGDSLENNVVRSSISRQPINYINKKVKATVVVRAKGSGTPNTPPEFGPLLRSCALKENIITTEGSECVEYTPANTSANMKTCTVYIYKDGLLVKAVGCMGNAKFSGRYGEYPSLEFEMEGLLAGIEDAANPAATYDGTEPMEMKSEGFAFGSWGDAVAREFGFETGNTLVSRGNVNSPTGLMPYIITERDPKWSSTVEAVLEATNSFWGDYQSRATVALSLTHGTASGNIVKFEASKANFDAPTFSEESSLNMYGLSGQLLETSGEDNFKLTFK